MSDTPNREPPRAKRLFGDFAPALVGFTEDVLFGQVWTRPQLSPKERSLVTVAALTTSGNTDQLRFHLALGADHVSDARVSRTADEPFPDRAPGVG